MRRGILEIYYLILKRVSKSPVIFTHLFSDTRLNQTACRGKLDFLIEKGWVQINPPFKRKKMGKSIGRSYYTLTGEGREIMKVLDGLYQKFNFPSGDYLS